MPDERTALMGDDATNGGLFMFVADKAQDLSSGTLYVAKWNQLTPTTAARPTLLDQAGQRHQREIKALADS
jgi:hypothetical protein